MSGTVEDFRNWCKRLGFSAASAAEKLGVSRITVIRGRTSTPPGSALSKHAETIEALWRSKASSDDTLDAAAALADWCDITDEHLAHIAGMTAASARGWTSENVRRTWLSFAPRTKVSHLSDREFVAIRHVADAMDGVELRTDDEGRSYRVAGPVLTVVEVCENADLAGPDGVREVVDAALRKDVKRDEVIALAVKRGTQQAVEAWVR